jgi:hypothetical protein
LVKDLAIESYSLIRQPYRITMARWNFSVLQKRILTKIISKLQREISLLQQGAELEHLELFKKFHDNSGTIELKFLLSEFIRDECNYAHFKKAISQLRASSTSTFKIVLPAVKSKKAKKPEEELILTGLIDRAGITKYARDITISLHKAAAVELLKVDNGLTVIAENVMYQTNNKYTQKIYELICQWKDIGVLSLSVEKFRELLVLEKKYPGTKELIRKVIRFPEKELKAIGDVFFDFGVTKRGNIITHFNFIIKTRANLKAESEHMILVREDTINLLRQHFGFKTHHFEEIKEILGVPENIPGIRSKLTELALLSADKKQHNQPVNNLPAWTIASIKNEFGKPGNP